MISKLPRWIWSGTAICGIPSEVSRAMLKGWHANNGVVLGNPRLGFVCTGQTVDGRPGLEGYFTEWDNDLTAEERLQFSPDERCPPFHAELAPRLPDNAWPEERLQKVLRNYSMEYITSIVPETIAVLGPDEGSRLAGAAARLIGMHTFDEVAAVHLEQLGDVHAGHPDGHQYLDHQFVARRRRHVRRRAQPRGQLARAGRGDREDVLRAVRAVRLDQAVALQALQGRVDLADVERPHLTGTGFEFLPQLQAVLGTLAEQGQQCVTDAHTA